MTTKICNTCKLEKNLKKNFNFRKDTNKYISQCKKCLYSKAKETRENMSEEKKNKIKKQKRINNRTLNGRFLSSRRGAKYRNYCYELSKKDYGKLTNNQLCIYCGGTDGTEYNKYVGVDRVCNEIGYKIGNVVSCCRICNIMKMEMSYVQFINVCNMIAKKHNNKF